MSKNSNLCIIANKRDEYSQTFVRNHIRFLSAKPIFIQESYKYISSPLQKFMDRLLSKIIFDYDIEKKNTERYIKHMMKELKADIVLVEFTNNAIKALGPCKKLKIPMVVHCHGHDVYNRKRVCGYGSQLEKLFKYAISFIAVSDHMKKRLIDLGCSANKITVNSCGVDINLFKPKEDFSDDVIYLAVGRFVEKKAPDIVIKAFVESLKKYPAAKLVYIGDGEMLKRTKDLVEELGVEDKVSFLGKRSNREVQEYMQKARVFVQHSVEAENGDSEGMPVSIMEAMATGLPVVSTIHSGIPELVVEGTGFLVKERDFNSMADAMVKLAKDKSLAQKMGKSGRIIIEERHGLDRSIDCIKDLIKKQYKIYD